MNNLMRNLTLSAAALAALVTFAPKAAADEYGRGRDGRRHEWREHAYRGPGRCVYVPPIRIVYGPRCAVPFRIHHGRRPVTNGRDVAGLVVGCSENFSVAISLLNLDFRLSARIKSNGYFGSLSWDGRNYRYAILSEIPQHIAINKGDTIETTGFSSVFPEGIPIGTISNLKKSGSDFYNIKVELFTDFKKLHYVNIIGNLKRSEQLKLENQFQ